MRKVWFVLPLFAVLLMGNNDCQHRPDALEQQQIQRREEIGRRDVYIPHNDVEFNNYNRRQRLADDPNTILWCTFFPPTMGQEPFTVPVVGKLTSGQKRPFPTEQEYNGTNNNYLFRYEPELVQPDGMFGSSGDYRYGFTPADMYVEFTDMSSFCTTEPTVWQRNETRIVVEVDLAWRNLNDQAREALQNNRPQEALRLLQQIERQQRHERPARNEGGE
jgi:hypothetical protein